MYFKRLIGSGLALTLLIAIGGCATERREIGSRSLAEAADPGEPVNRAMLALDNKVRRNVVRPVVSVYRAALPEAARHALRRALDNFHAPAVFIHDLLQGSVRRAEHTAGRFALNTTVGFFGFFDVAAEVGIPGHTEDFGQTLGVWGMGAGAYAYLPVLGPTSARDGLGLVLDAILLNPLRWVGVDAASRTLATRASFGAQYLSAMDENIDNIEELNRGSIDFYAALKSAYLQSREAEIRNGGLPALLDMDQPN